MINTYEDYLNHSSGEILLIEDAFRIYTDMAASIKQCRAEDKQNFWNDFLKRASEYTKMRNDWEFMTKEEKMENDEHRSALHNMTITSLNILSRITESEEIDNSWRIKLGDDRKRIGDFACFVTYITGISNR